MAEFVNIDKNIYKIEGTLTEEDINKINLFKNRTTLILDNTIGLTSELISKINSERIVFSIKGGLDYDKKEKFRDKNYLDRTLVSPSGLKNIIKYFEYSENLIDPNWNEFEKAMFLYNSLVVDMDYDEHYENILPRGVTERSLNGILYGKLVCAGFALTYKEMLDRVGIKNYYQNEKDVHSFNIIEIDGKKYGVDVTWDNNDKKNNNGRCGFRRFGHDPEFYGKHGHKLYKEIDISDDFENPILKKIYDKDEEEFALSVLSMDQLNDYYSHIVSRIYERKPLKYNLHEQTEEIRNKYLPVDLVNKRLKQEASNGYPIVTIINFLKKRNALEINPSLIESFSNRGAYLLDMGNSDGKYTYGIDLSVIGIDNYEIDKDGSITFKNGMERRHDAISGVRINNSTMSQEEIQILCNKLNQYLNEYLSNYLLDVFSNLDSLLKDYEYKPDEWDNDRALESANIYTKLAFLINNRDNLIKLGIDEKKVDNIMQKITTKYEEIHKPYRVNTSQKELDLDFLSAVFNDINMIKQLIEYDLKKEISEEEFVLFYKNIDYMINLLEKYVTIAEDKKFKLDDYNISMKDLEELLNKLMEDYHKKKTLNDLTEYDSQNLEIKR